MTDKPRVLFYFLHLLGVGHVHRAQRLMAGFAEAGLAVDVIYGGEPIEGIVFDAETVSFLPPIKAADNSYFSYLDADGNPLSPSYQEKRTKKLLEIFRSLQPDLILTEAFPFGRRMVRHELQALFDVARKRKNPPLIVSSVRDILQERKKPGRVEETKEWIDNYFDHILVHSDPDIIKLDETYPLAHAIQQKLAYTGFVVPQQKSAIQVPDSDIIVSAGGGAFGEALLQTSVDCAFEMSSRKFLISTGPNCPPNIRSQLKANAPQNTTIVESLDNLSAHLQAAKISISQCGYNTAMDALAAHTASDCRAIFVPYDTEGQSEQLRRAELLADKGYAINIPQSQLNTQGLIDAVKHAEKLKRVDHPADFEGVTKSSALISDWIKNRS